MEPAKHRKALELITPPEVEVARDDSFVTSLAEIGKPISAALKSNARMTMLAVTSLDDRLSFDIHRMGLETLSTSVAFTHNPASERGMKAIFERLGLQVPLDSGVPEHFLKDHPVQSIYRISPEPAEAEVLASLAILIFRDFCGLEPKSGVRVCFWEMTDAT